MFLEDFSVVFVSELDRKRSSPSRGKQWLCGGESRGCAVEEIMVVTWRKTWLCGGGRRGCAVEEDVGPRWRKTWLRDSVGSKGPLGGCPDV